ncbi:UNVERIFIED_CONTAM: hypothetical protein GTU68_025054 [Idotea baltica]|nr:hypothetical protein [Idotea baltica]
MQRHDLIDALMAKQSRPVTSVRFIVISLTLKSRCV